MRKTNHIQTMVQKLREIYCYICYYNYVIKTFIFYYIIINFNKSIIGGE
jgi:hypothetical protein